MSAAAHRTPAIAFLALLAPFGISAGFVAVTLAWQLHAAGLGTGLIAGLIALTIWPNTWKVLWAPLVDTTLTFKRWYVIGTVLTAISLLILGLIAPVASNYTPLALMIVVSAVASSVTAMAAEAMMAETIEDERRGIVSGWAQAGNLGGSGLGGGLALFLSQHVAGAWVPGLGVGLLCFACSAVLPLVRLGDRVARPRLAASLGDVAREMWALLRSRIAVTAIVLMLLPIGSGGVQSLWSTVAGDWHTGADTVALVNGALGGVASLIGALIGGWLCDKLDRRLAYCLFGLLVAAAAGTMAMLPRSPTVFVVMTLAYAVALGACYAAYSAVVLEAIGRDAAATKFQLLAAISNVPIALVTTWDGQLYDARGASGMLDGEVLFGVAGAAFFGLFVVATRSRAGPKGVASGG